LLFICYTSYGDIMELIVGKYCGFCAGVNYTISKSKEILNNTKENIYSLGEIIHNERVIKELESIGLITVNSLDEIPDNSKVIFRAHGEPLARYERAKEKNLDIIDLTCSKVKLIHDKVKDKKDTFIIVIGKKNHPETIGTLGFNKNSFAIMDIDDINECYKVFKESKLNKIYIVAQTTFNDNLFDECVNIIKDKFKDIEIIVDKTICAATSLRQNEVKEIAGKVNKMIIIGGKHSSNTKELANVAEKYLKDVYLIQEVDDIKDYTFNKEDIIGITAGASTPKELINEVVEYLNEVI